MAIYHFKMTPIRRGEGRSAVAAVAYRAGEKITDSRTGQVHNYRRRGGVAEAGIIGWHGSRRELWNAGEHREKHPRAVVAREIVIALPHELTAAARRKLVTDFGEYLHKRHGVAVDWAIHQPPARSPLNFHAHLMLTTRVIENDGLSLGIKTRELDQKDTGGQHLRAWRQEWSEMVNNELWLAGIQKTVDHRTHRAAGRNREPQEHLGPAATVLSDLGIATAGIQRNRRRRYRDRARKLIAANLREVSHEIAYQLSRAVRRIASEVIDEVSEPPQLHR